LSSAPAQPILAAMTEFPIHTVESAPPASQEPLGALTGALGFTPNLAAAMSGSPALIGGFMDLRARIASEGLDGVEREIVALATSRQNGCDYCMAVHSTFALTQGADAADVAGARDGDGPPDPKLGALYRFTRSLLADAADPDDLAAAGYAPETALTVAAQIGFTTLANLGHRLTRVPVDDAFAAQAWQPTQPVR
jgi:AhpD family alkylhydroperoxidase